MNKQEKMFLFDWGDTLMVDFPGVSGKMCDWEVVKAVEGSHALLQALSDKARIYVATAAVESSPNEIAEAFRRVDLHRYVTGYFCRENTGFIKPDPQFYEAILDRLEVAPESIVMVGDSLANDVLPCRALGMQAVWLETSGEESIPAGTLVVKNLKQLREMWFEEPGGMFSEQI